MKASNCDLHEIGARMAAAREKLGLTQAAFSEQFGHGSLRTYQKNEAGTNEGGLCLVAAFVRAGINANWLLTGAGPMLLAELGKAQAPEPINVEALEAILRGTLLGIPKAPPEIIARQVASYYAQMAAQDSANEA